MLNSPTTGLPYRHYVNDQGDHVSIRKGPIYYGFEPKVVELDGEDGSKEHVVIGLERLAYMVEDIHPLHKEHWAETETLYLEDPMLPDYTRLTELEERNQFVVFTIRSSDEKMVGYLMYYMFRSIHISNKFEAREDAFFITKDFRGAGLAHDLLQFAEDALKQLGCKYVGMSSKAPAGGPDIGGFLERKGYKPVSLYYLKQLQE